MAWPVRAMPRDGRSTRRYRRVRGSLRVEEEEHTLSAAQKDMPPGLPTDDLQANDIPIKAFRSVQVRTVEGRLEHARRLQPRLRHCRTRDRTSP